MTHVLANDVDRVRHSLSGDIPVDDAFGLGSRRSGRRDPASARNTARMVRNTPYTAPKKNCIEVVSRSAAKRPSLHSPRVTWCRAASLKPPTPHVTQTQPMPLMLAERRCV